jgi:hypothetical protein
MTLPTSSKPLALTLALASLVLFLGWQLVLSLEIHGNLRQSLKGREALVGQSQQIQGGASKLLSDLIDLSERNANARAVVQKFGISRNPNAP